MAFAREIFQQIKNYFRFQRAEKEMDSHYTILGNTLVRVSNHCTYMYVWDNYFEKNPKDRSMNIISLVFEDNGNTFNNDCLVLKRNRKRPINVSEYVFPINGNGKFITSQDIKTIIKDLKKLENEGVYNDSTSKSEIFKRTSINPTSQNISQTEDGNLIHTPISGWGYGADYVSENKKYKTNRKMKQTIRLNESDLHRMIKESVKQVLNEDESFDYNGNKDKDDYKLIFSIRAWVRKIHTIVSGLENALQNGRLEDYETVRGFIPQVVEKLRFVASNIEDDAIALKDNNNFEI